jgi:hypothetical protein
MSYPIHVYKIFWSDCDDFYIGSTKRKLCKRMTCHRHECKEGKQLKLYNFMREKGLYNFQYVLISTHTVCSKDEQRKYEQLAIDLLNPTLNMHRAFCSKEYRKVYRQDKNRAIREQKKAYNKEYHKANKEKLNQQMKEYRQRNKQKIKQYQKEYHEKNKERMKAYRQANKEKISQRRKEKIQCECGAVIGKGDKSKHLQSKKHQFYESIYNFVYS